MRQLLAAIAALALSVPAHALTAEQIVEKEIVIQNPDGTETRERMSAATVAPGDRVVYSVRVLNDGTEAADALVLTQPVPTEVAYIEGSAERPGAVLTVSVDGGVTFGPRGAATVMREGVAVTADAGDITHLRWTLQNELAPGGTDTVTYKGVLK